MLCGFQAPWVSKVPRHHTVKHTLHRHPTLKCERSRIDSNSWFRVPQKAVTDCVATPPTDELECATPAALCRSGRLYTLHMGALGTHKSLSHPIVHPFFPLNDCLLEISWLLYIKSLFTITPGRQTREAKSSLSEGFAQSQS